MRHPEGNVAPYATTRACLSRNMRHRRRPAKVRRASRRASKAYAMPSISRTCRMAAIALMAAKTTMTMSIVRMDRLPGRRGGHAEFHRILLADRWAARLVDKIPGGHEPRPHSRPMPVCILSRFGRKARAGSANGRLGLVDRKAERSIESCGPEEPILGDGIHCTRRDGGFQPPVAPSASTIVTRRCSAVPMS